MIAMLSGVLAGTPSTTVLATVGALIFGLALTFVVWALISTLRLLHRRYVYGCVGRRRRAWIRTGDWRSLRNLPSVKA